MAHAIFSVYEILEYILLHTDQRTILRSQRVCRRWRTLINTSNNLQEALFFKPVRYQVPFGSEDRIRNSLVEDHLWPRFLQSDDDAYTRPEASWRWMLFQQPPTSTICVIEYTRLWGNPQYRCIKFTKPDDDFLRMGDVVVDPVLNAGNTKSISILVPGQDKWVFWHERNFDLNRVKALEEEFEGIREVSPAMHLEDCDFIVFTRLCGYLRPGSWHDPEERQLTRWLESLGKGEHIQDWD